MTILASVSDGLALLAAGAALIAAARALQMASRLAPRPPATTPATVRPQPTASAPPSPPVAISRNDATASNPADNGSSARGNELREQLRALLADRSDQELSLVQVANALGRSSATVSYALEKLVAAGDVELASPKPRRYRITTAGASAPRQAALPAAAPAPASVTGRAEQTGGTPAAESPRTPKPASAPRGANAAKARGGLRDEVRAVLASRPDETLSLVEISNAVGRATATVNYQLDRLMESGEVTLAGDKPRRYAIAASAQLRPSVPAGTPKREAATAAEPSSPGGRRASRRTPAEPAQRKPAHASNRGGRARKKTADAATGEVAATAS